MKKIFNKIKKWNWNAFVFFMLLSAIAVLGNTSTTSWLEWTIIMTCVALPYSLAFAIITKEE